MSQFLWLPPDHEQRLAEERLRYNAETAAQVEKVDFLETWNHELKRIDERLVMVQAKENTNHPALKPGRFYVLLVDAGVPTAIFPPDGSGYEEPSSQVYEDIARWDGWSTRSARQREKRAEEIRKAQEYRRRREHEDRVEHAMEFIHSQETPWVSFNRDHRWTNSTRGKRGRKT